MCRIFGGYFLMVYCLNFQLKRSSSKPKTEVGTQNDKNDVDYDWLPKETTDFSKCLSL